jgi:hypothetical protein
VAELEESNLADASIPEGSIYLKYDGRFQVWDGKGNGSSYNRGS